LYRRFFLDLDEFVRAVQARAPAQAILEVGCGEGALTEKLARAYPQARLTGIDITPRVGRLFRGDGDRVTFLQQTIQEFAVSHAAAFDLVVVCDVIHHIPWDQHSDFLRHVKETLRPEGMLVLKDWEKRVNVAHLLAYLSDRYLTGDRIRFGKAADFRALLGSVFGAVGLDSELRIRPWRNNLAFFLRA
jgi:2-polyprenyl-6-hydroxyphenyl methylase/3-demethylubiquinone-9 3-methyltransferase